MSLHAFSGSRFGERAGGEHPRLINLEVTAAPATEVVSLSEAKEWLRVDGTDQDTTITSLIEAATQWAEGFTKRAFINRDLRAIFAHFPLIGLDFYLPFPNVTGLTTLTYVDGDGTDQVFDIADLDVEPTFGLLRVKPDAVQDWPQAVHSVRADYTGGFGVDASDVPENVKTAIKISIAQMFEVRVDQTFGAQASKPQTKSSEALLRHFKMFQT